MAIKKHYLSKSLEFIIRKKKITTNIKKVKINSKLEKKGTLIIKNSFSSINFRDHLAFFGNKGVTRHYPFSPGVDLVGRVIKTKTKKFKIGDKVGAFAIPINSVYPGCWSTYCLLNEKHVFKLNKKVNLKNLISIGTAGLAATAGIIKLKKNYLFSRKNNFSLLVTGASGGVGSVSCILGKNFNWEVTAITRNKKKKFKFLNKIGVDKIIETKKFILSNDRNLLVSKYDGIIDSLGGEVLTNSIKMLKNNGVCISAGLTLDQKINNLTVLPFLLRGITLAGSGAEVLNKNDKKNALNLAISLSNSKKLRKITNEIKFDKVDYYLKNWITKPPGRIIIKLN